AGSKTSGLLLADFDNDGRLDVATSSATQQAVIISSQDDGTVVSLSPTKIHLPNQLVGKVSDPKVVTMTNTVAGPVTVGKISIDTGFLQFNNCYIVQPGGSCKIATLFAPTIATDFIGYLSVTDDGGGSPQSVELFGQATVITLTPDHLDFGSLPVGRI